MMNIAEPQPYSERKQSSGDLQSRLKTRKLLGVGECEDGSVPVSKISQILGNDEHYVRNLPNGLRMWQMTTAFIFTFISLLAILIPVPLFNAIFASNSGPDAVLPIRLFGATLSCLSILFWSAAQSINRDIIKWTMLSQVLVWSIQSAVTVYALWDRLLLVSTAPFILILLFASTVSLYFYACMSGYNTRWLWKPRMTVYDTGSDKTN